MIDSDRRYFEEFEIEHNLETYYANGYVTYDIEKGVGSNYEGCDYEIIYHVEICEIYFYELWYNDEDTDDVVDILGKPGYSNIEEIARDAIRYEYE